MSRDLAYMLDYIAIRELSVEYNRSTNRGDGEAYVKVWAPDGVLDLGPMGTHVGHEALAKATENNGRKANHLSLDWKIDIEGDTATQSAVMLAKVGLPDGGFAITTGMYDDVLVRTPEGWRFKSRHFTLD